ncbi:monovalent cation/H(+) antiporter subunit G [Nocardia puris]|uniref:Multisubunit sodium/proton antiporter MrpG subunit n=1 Tax=Nocardia puris TaxID=208602 RepID=A0A366DE41_9NOCA|nr:monovalent cation/H(+) antiporter subunit G [Nocardia puris]MBF6211207.1 monovalent cation/H(+) antiporter subunit G [Nocardia puris]MBF6364926.1 monovalent cation/H(+) antiporter subunit G [Nocardia puris]MBF6458712.1 monovalent cation/H(+) antiporter subunit G [Nocardia puris]RBO87789.1 multisubunit sodium/proton antiporter MrpG subunit [Nocardia puris]
MTAWQWVSSALILSGSVLACTAAIAIVRFPDTFTRMHAATKPQVVGLVLVLTGTGLEIRDKSADVWMLALVALFALLTAPVIAHLIGRTAYREQRHRDGLLRVNELGDELD